MTSPRHHLTEPLLSAYAAGSLPEAFSLVVATHVSLCDECRARLAAHEAVGGAVLDSARPASLAADSLSACLARIANTDAPPRRSAVALSDAAPVFPAPLRDYVGGDVDAVAWRRVGGGVKQMVLRTGGTETVRLLSIPGGTRMPDHGHRGIELTLVLSGAFRDEEDRFGRGDLEVADDTLIHTPHAEDGEPCICLAATEAPLRFQSMVPRIVGRITGI